MLNTSTEKSFAGTEKFTEGQRLCPQGLEDVTNRHRLERLFSKLTDLTGWQAWNILTAILAK
jgi:hypothetical protein